MRVLRNRLLLVPLACVFGSLLMLAGCERGEREERVVLYTSIDGQHAQAIVQEFERQTGHRVRLVTDTEATKSVGLAQRLRAERDRPRADVFWGNEVFYTSLMAEEGLFAPYDSPAAEDVLEQFRDPEGLWTAVGLRARVLAVSDQLDEQQAPRRLEDLLDERFRGSIAIARPTTGTTGGHVASLYAVLGQEEADSFFAALHENGIALLASNSMTSNQVGAGNYLAALTDNDDIVNTIEAGGRVWQVLPDQGEGEMGTLLIPTTVSLVAGRPENPAARELAEFLLSSANEQALIDQGFAAYSVRGPAAEDGQPVRAMQVDYAEAARMMPEAIRRATALMEGRTP